MSTLLQPRRLLDTFPLVRSHNLDEASDRIGRVFSPHRLELRARGSRLDVSHNQVRLRNVSLNVLQYGADVVIDSGERGDFYMVQLPLSGQAQLSCDGQEVCVDSNVLSVLPPKCQNRMVWSGDCSMILIQVPRPVVEERVATWGKGKTPRFALSHSRQTPEVAAWWQTVIDLTKNVDTFGQEWLRYPAASVAMEEFLLSTFTTLLSEPEDDRRFVDRAGERRFRRAKEFIHANLDRALTSVEIAEHTHVCTRTLELLFKRYGEASPLAYARRCRLQAVHDALQSARQHGRSLSVTEVAFAHGFVHMGRFAAQYREQFGCSPSETLRPH